MTLKFAVCCKERTLEYKWLSALIHQHTYNIIIKAEYYLKVPVVLLILPPCPPSSSSSSHWGRWVVCQFDLVSSCETVHNDDDNLYLHSTFKDRVYKGLWQSSKKDNKHREKHSTVESNARKSSWRWDKTRRQNMKYAHTNKLSQV